MCVYAQLSPHDFSQDEVWTLTGPLQRSADLLACLRSLSCCMTQFWPSFSCRTDVVTFDSTILSSIVELGFTLVYKGVHG